MVLQKHAYLGLLVLISYTPTIFSIYNNNTRINNTAYEEDQCEHTEQHNKPHHVKPQWKQFLTKYATTLIPSVTIGVTTGIARRYFDGTLPLPRPTNYLVSWLLFSSTRDALVTMITHDMHYYHIPNNTYCSFTTAQIAHWIAWAWVTS